MEETVELRCNGKHKYHLKCIQQWTEYKQMCPMCRKDIIPEWDDLDGIDMISIF
jgi:hypothetical protein